MKNKSLYDNHISSIGRCSSTVRVICFYIRVNQYSASFSFPHFFKFNTRILKYKLCLQKKFRNFSPPDWVETLQFRQKMHTIQRWQRRKHMTPSNFFRCPSQGKHSKIKQLSKIIHLKYDTIEFKPQSDYLKTDCIEVHSF